MNSVHYSTKKYELAKADIYAKVTFCATTIVAALKGSRMTGCHISPVAHDGKHATIASAAKCYATRETRVSIAGNGSSNAHTHAHTHS